MVHRLVLLRLLSNKNYKLCDTVHFVKDCRSSKSLSEQKNNTIVVKIIKNKNWYCDKYCGCVTHPWSLCILFNAALAERTQKSLHCQNICGVGEYTLDVSQTLVWLGLAHPSRFSVIAESIILQSFRASRASGGRSLPRCKSMPLLGPGKQNRESL